MPETPRTRLPRSATAVVDQAVATALSEGGAARGLALTRAELAAATGLSPAAVTAATRRLTERGALRVEPGGPTDQQGRGRPARRYRLPPASGHTVVTAHLRRDRTTVLTRADALEHRDDVSAGGGEPGGAEVTTVADARGRRVTDWPTIRWDTWARHVDRALDRSGCDRARTTVVVAVPTPWRDDAGPVRPQRLPAAVRDTVLARGGLDLPDWLDRDLPERLADRLGCEVVVGNDANLAGLGEMTYGAGRAAASGLHLSIRDGLGAALIVDGRLVTGARGRAGELAHVQVDPGGGLCSCGNRGCLATAASPIRTVDALSGIHGVSLTADDVDELIAHADSATLLYFTDLGRKLGAAVAPVVTLFDPHCLLVDATLGRAADAVVAGLREELIRRCAPAVSQALTIVPGTLPEPVTSGALAVVRTRQARRGVGRQGATTGLAGIPRVPSHLVDVRP